MAGGDWKSTADSKRQAILESLPSKWRIADLPSNEAQKDVTGKFVQQYLSEKEITITESDVVKLAQEAAAGNWTAVEITEAFCHRASLAHQMVKDQFSHFEAYANTAMYSSTAFMRPSSMLHLPTRRSSTNIMLRTTRRSVHSTACR